MTTDLNKMKENYRQWFRAFNAHDINQLDRLADELFAPDYILHDPGVPSLPPGPAGVKLFVRGALQNTSAMTIVLDDLFAEGDRVSMRFTVSSIDPSTGNRVSVWGLAIGRYSNGKIAEEWELTHQEPAAASV